MTFFQWFEFTDMQYFLSYRNYTSLFTTASMKTNKDAADEDSDDFMWYLNEQSVKPLGCVKGDHWIERLDGRSEEFIMKSLIHKRSDKISSVVVIVVAGRSNPPLKVAKRWYYITLLIPEIFNGSDIINHVFFIDI